MLVRRFLIPVKVFGADTCDACGAEGGYGLMDAVEPWSDCNRAIGHIFRVGDLPQLDEKRGIAVWLEAADVPALEQGYHDGEA